MPTPQETASLSEFLRHEADARMQEATAAERPLTETDVRRQALEQLCRAILNLNEFVYTD